MHLEILTPEKKVFEGDVHLITLPGVDGSFQLLDNHAPLLSLLKKGVVRYDTNQETSSTSIEIMGGVVETVNNKTIVLASGLVE